MSLISVPRSPARNGAPSLGGPRGRLQRRDSFVMVQGSALLVEVGSVGHDPHQSPSTPTLPLHLRLMCEQLEPQHNIKLAIQLESSDPNRSRYFLLVSSEEENENDETIVVGMDITTMESGRMCSIGLVLPIWRDTQVYLDGDGGFSVTNADRTCVFKPLNIQAMWTVLQGLHTCCQGSVRRNLFPGCGSLLWSNHYTNRLGLRSAALNDWNLLPDLQPPCLTLSLASTECMETEIRSNLRSVMMDVDFETVTSKQIRSRVEQRMGQDLKEFCGFLDNEMLLILAQMDRPSEVFDFLYLGTEWNAANLQELEDNGVGYILNVTREIDNFFPGRFTYMNIRVHDEENADLLSHWENTYRFISTARSRGSRCLVHCKMGVSRSASTVLAFAMKDRGWNLQRSLDHVLEQRTVVRPNPGFMSQLLIYHGIVQASAQRHNALWRKRSLSNPPILSPLPHPPSASTTRPDSPSASTTRPESPSTTRPDSPSASTTRPDSPSASTTRPESPSGSTTRPDSPSAPTTRPESPSASTTRPHSPSALTTRPESPTASTTRPDSPSASTTRPESPTASITRPDSPSALTTRPESPSASTTNPDSPSASTTRPDFPSASTTGPDSPLALTTGPDSPSASTTRPESPSASTTRPDSPSTSTTKPESPSASTTRPDSPSASTTRPESPSASTTRPDSPSASTIRPDSPSASTTRPESLSVFFPGPQSPSVSAREPDSLSASTTRPDSPSVSTTRPESLPVFSPGPQSPSVSARGPESLSASTTKPRSPRAPPPRPFLRSSSFGQSRVSLSTVMSQVEAMEAEGESEEGVLPRARGWKRVRAFSLQGGLGLEQRLRSLKHSNALDFSEEEENAISPLSPSPPPHTPSPLHPLSPSL